MEISDITLTISQQRVLDSMLSFVESGSERVFILKGYAGTVKTTLMKFLVKELQNRSLNFRLLASMGRAAKVLQNLSESDDYVSTIHSMVYSFGGLNKDFSNEREDRINADEGGQLFLVFEPRTVQSSVGKTIYIVDESSMITDALSEYA